MLYEMLTGESPFMGENVNAIMFQTLNTVPAAPSTLNSAVPDMLNFIVAKALAKELDDRYQNARDFANDLRACRETMPRSGRSVDVAGADRRNLAVGVVNERRNAEDSSAPATLGLSSVFDSTEATMRLAALTTTPEDVDELSRTLKIKAVNKEPKAPAPGSPSSPRASVPPRAVPPRVAPAPKAPADSRDGGGKLLILLLAVLLLIIAIYAR
jgi:serine/threonine-protein kinase